MILSGKTSAPIGRTGQSEERLLLYVVKRDLTAFRLANESPHGSKVSNLRITIGPSPLRKLEVLFDAYEDGAFLAAPHSPTAALSERLLYNHSTDRAIRKFYSY